MTASGLQGKVAIVTGAGRGIGAATARLLASHGAKLLLVSRTPSQLEQSAQSIREKISGTEIEIFCGDVSLPPTFEGAFSRALKSFGGVDILVNAAGIFEKAEIVDIEMESWNRVLNTNLNGSFLGCREMFRHARASGQGGCVVNISSLGGIRGTEKFPGMASYVVSKHAVVGLTEIAAVEGKKWGVRVNCVAPGAVDTEMLRKAAPFLKTRFLPEDLAEALLFFCDENRSGKISGSILEIHSNEG